MSDSPNDTGLPLTDEEVAEQRRAEQRAELRAARMAKVRVAAPWIGSGALAVVGLLCLWLSVGSAPLPGASTTGAAADTLTVTRVLPSSDATVGAPTGIAVSGDRVYIADARRKVVVVLTRDGSRVATIGAGWLRTPVYVAVGPVDGRVYVSDRTLGEVAVFASDGTRFGVLAPTGLRPGASSGPKWRPLALAFAPDGTLFVADSAAQQSIAVFSPAGSRTGTLGADVPVGRTGQRLAFVNGIAATADRIVAADSNNGRLLIFDRTGRFTGAIPVDGLPRGVVVTASAETVFTDAASDAVTVLDASDAPVQALTGGVGDRERLVAPAGLAVDAAGAVYALDSATGQVFVLGTAAAAGLPGPMQAALRWLLPLAGALALVLAALLAIRTVRRARARVRAQGVTL